MTKPELVRWPGSVRWLSLLVALLGSTAILNAQVPAAVISYSPSQTTVGFQPQSNLAVAMALQGMQSASINPRAYWNLPSFPLALVSYTPTSATVNVPPALRTTSGTNIIVVCATLGTTGQEICTSTNPQVSATFIVNPPPSITTVSPLPIASINTSYSVPLSATGGTVAVGLPPYSWSLQSGSTLPPNLTINPTTGVISGTPTQAGIFSFTVVVTDSLGIQGTKLFSLQVVSNLSIVTPATLPTAGLNVGYSTTIQVAGGVPPYSFSTNLSALPPGLVLNTQSGVLSGTPSVAGSYSFLVTVIDTQQNAAERIFFLTVSPGASTPTIQTGSPLPDATRNSPYSVTFQASGGIQPYQFFLLSGQFPPGLTLNSGTGTLSGTPTQTGTFNFAIDVLDAQEQVSNKSFVLTVVDGLQILTSSLPVGTVGVAYPNTTIQVSGGQSPYSFQAPSLPPGLFLSPSSGVLSGTPSQAGTFTFTVTVFDRFERRASRTLTVSISPGLRFRTTSPLPSGRVGELYSVQLEAEGGTAPYQFELAGGSLPPGITLSPAGLLRGTATEPFNGSFTVRAIDTGNPPLSVERLFALRISEQLVITTETLPAGVVQQSYSVALAVTGGVPSYAFLITTGSLPPGLLLSGTGTLSGTPTEQGSFTFTVRATDQEATSASRAFTLVIRPQPIPGVSVSVQTPNPTGNSQQNVGVTVSEPRSGVVDGMLFLEFAPSVTPAVDDPSIQFVSGGRQRSFQIPAGQTSAVFGSAQNVAFQTGTVAGTITVRAQLQVGGADATPTPPPTASLVLAPVAPTLTNLSVTRAAPGLSVQIRGFSTPRSMTSATLNFTARAGSNIQGGLSFTVDLASVFTTWYSGSQSAQFGSQFQLTIPVTVTGDATEITGLSVVLRNSVGDSNSLNATF